MKKHTILDFKKNKSHSWQMLTCYDYQTAQMLNETEVDLLLVGDSLGNVVLGFDSTIPVTLEMMQLFGSAVKRGAPDKFTVVDLPFGHTQTVEMALKSGSSLFQNTLAESIKLEGAGLVECKSIENLNRIGVPVMGHIGLTPQSVHAMGGYFTHGKNEVRAKQLVQQAKDLENAGAFAVVLECVTADLALEITEELKIPTIGIGSGTNTDGQVLVINDLYHFGKNTPPAFCKPIANLFNERKRIVEQHLSQQRQNQ